MRGPATPCPRSPLRDSEGSPGATVAQAPRGYSGTLAPWRTSLPRRCGSGFLVGKERAEQLVVGAEWAPTRWWRRGQECRGDLSSALLVRLWSEANPGGERHGGLQAGFVVKHDRPTLGKALGQFTHE